MPTARWTGVVLLGLAALAAHADPGDVGRPEPGAVRAGGWSFHIDNDAFGLTPSDRDYTGGFAFTLYGDRVLDHPLSIHALLRGFDRLVGVERLARAGRTRRHALEFGIAAFTPSDITRAEPVPDDHPYGCVIFVGATTGRPLPAQGVSYDTNLTLGLLGTSVCETMQEGLHATFSGDDPRGWDHQISDGGEPTFRWSLNRNALLWARRGAGGTRELVWTAEAALGGITGLGVGLGWRSGRIASPWWSFTPQEAEYIVLGGGGTGDRGRGDRYLWAGLMLRYRLYNVLLQGQFRDSDVTFSRDELRPVVGEAWVGYTFPGPWGLELSVAVRARSQEIEALDDIPVWGSLVIRRPD
ncbi:lipid A deacylase LpxR family protein [Inmirania thermothiophila]|uniref:Uncharacterized protein DUF2219 n=1 Tax=Inmirania thermothiophila TaxID=1750597 RepID=A0A3N1Y8I0_9GAMM|nr:lipid A deacylase LpxR family protein [Inmirania thermothiophila]ROR35124.1 uncharacterized protein DUF2219 [Inmirania thermothiophila]